MPSIQFVDEATARDATGVRLAVSGIVPSPWSEAAKGLFRLQDVPVLAVRSMRTGDLSEWTRAHNVPVAFFDREPPRTSWAAIVALADRLGAPGALLPTDVLARATTVGLIHELAGEDGLGWNARLLMIHATFETKGERGFPIPASEYLAAKYGYAADRLDAARARIAAALTALKERLGAADYFGGARPNALDVYSATFLTPLTPIADLDCPRLSPRLRQAFATAYEDVGADIPAALLTHRQRMFERHLAWPIEL